MDRYIKTSKLQLIEEKFIENLNSAVKHFICFIKV